MQDCTFKVDTYNSNLIFIFLLLKIIIKNQEVFSIKIIILQDKLFVCIFVKKVKKIII